MTVTLKKIGGSLAVIIPGPMAKEMKLLGNTQLELSSDGTVITMRRQGRRPRRSMKEIVAKMNSAAYKKHNATFLNDKPVGKEIW